MTQLPAGESMLSIITPSYNRVSMIEDAILSVLNQPPLNYEHIVVDGASTDGTLEIISRYKHLKVLSEPDTGLYEAMNKGIGLSRGGIIGFLSTDDIYADNLAEVVEVFRANPEAQAVIGARVVFEGAVDNMRKLRSHPCIDQETLWKRLTVGPPATNTWFFRREVFNRIGLFDTRYKYSGDRDFLLRFATAGLPLVCLPKVVYFNRQHPGSITQGASAEKSRSGQRLQIKIKMESLQIAEETLATPNLPGEAKDLVARFHRVKAYQILTKALTTFQLDLASNVWQRARKLHPHWFSKFVGMVLNPRSTTRATAEAGQSEV